MEDVCAINSIATGKTEPLLTEAIMIDVNEGDMLKPRSLRGSNDDSENRLSSTSSMSRQISESEHDESDKRLSSTSSTSLQGSELEQDENGRKIDWKEISTTVAHASSIEDAYPCTPLQEGLMALSMLQHSKYTPRMVYSLPKMVDVQRFKLAWQETVDSNPILRTIITQTSQSEMIQQVLTPSEIDWMVATDLDHYLWLDRQKSTGIRRPLFRYAIVSDTMSSTAYFVWTLHHAAIDGWSVHLLLDQVEKRYSGGAFNLLDPFGKYIAYISTQNGHEIENFWSEKLAGITANHFPPSPPSRLFCQAESSIIHYVKLPKYEKDLGTISTLIQTAWALVLGRRTSSVDVLYGVVLAGRNSGLEDIKTICGPTFTTIPFRLSIKPGQSGRELMNSVRMTKTEMKRYQHAGIQNIQRLSPDCSFACKFQNLLVVQPFVEENPDGLFGKRFKESSHWNNLTTYSLLLQCQVTSDGFTAHAVFDEDAIHMDEMRAVLREFESNISHLLAHPDQPLDNIKLPVPESISSRQKYSSGSPKVDSNLHEIIEGHVEHQPNAIALQSWDGQLSREELSRLSSTLAWKLRKRQIPGKRNIPLLFEKSLWTVVAMMASMKVGGTFVALNPSDPTERLRERVQQLESDFVLCSEGCFERFQGLAHEMIIVGPSLWEEAAPICASLDPVPPTTIVYVVFTSGSTGKPKGVEIEHSACCSSLTRLIESYAIDSHTRFLQFSSYSFDGCILEIFGTLMAGGCVCIPSDETRLDGIAGFITKEQVNFAFFVTSFARTINPADVASLKTLAVGGETVRQEDVDQWFGKLKLFITYGPTECCVMCTALEIKSSAYNAGQLGALVVGEAVVIDDYGRIAETSIVGELHVGGPALAKGYLDDPARTAAAFRRDDPWILSLGGSSDTWYKTGDLVRMGPNGAIEYIGRKDKQVKIRGQRIELGEVEFHVQKCLADVRDLAVNMITPADDPESPLLVIFAVSGRQRRLGGASKASAVFEEPLSHDVSFGLWDQLTNSLPEHMVPSVIFPISHMPLSTTGKKDVNSLLMLAGKLRKDEMMMYSCAKREFKRPTNEREETMQRAWAEVLNLSLDCIGRNDSFIRLGGDSIRAMKLAAVCRREGLDLAVADVFRRPRLCDLALAMKQSEDEAKGSNAAPQPFTLMKGRRETQDFLTEIVSQCKINSDQIEDIYPCTPLQEGMMALSLKRPGAYAVRHEIELSSDLVRNLEAFRLSWEHVIESCPILRTRIIHTEQDGFLQVVVRERAHWCTIDSSKEKFRDTQDSIMAVGSPLSLYTVAITADDEGKTHVFGWTMHHSIYDARSMQLILEQVENVYRTLVSEGPLSEQDVIIRHPDVNFNTFIEKTVKCNIDESDQFWGEQLSNGEPKMFPNVAPDAVPLPRAELESIVELPTQTELDVTTSTLVRAAWALTVSFYADSEDIVFGVTLSGRTSSVDSFDTVVGPTIATVPVRIQCSLTMSAEDFLDAVHNQSLEMAPFEQIGLARLHRMSSEAKDACNFQNLLVVQYEKESDRTDGIFSRLRRSAVHIGVFDTYALTMECTIQDHSLRIKAIFDPHIIDATQMQRVICHFKYILYQICTNRGRGLVLKDMQTANPEDLETIWTWNAQLPETLEACVHTLIQEHILSAPKAQAICAWDGDFSYQELDALSSNLAQHLMALGVGPEVVVPVLFYKSKWYIVAILGILKAGGAFAPLEPTHPVARLLLIVDALKSALLLCSPELKDVVSSVNARCKIVSLNDFDLDQIPSTSEDISSPVCPGNTAYVVFTSGTTGTPKGIVVEHRAYSSSARDHAVALGFHEKSRHLQFASHSFDTSIEDILTTLITGGCICIPSEREREGDIVAAMERMEVNKADLTPSFLSYIKPSSIPNLEILILGGEPLTPKVIRDWADRVRLVNAYGTSECAVTNLVNHRLSCDTEASNIGRAVGAVAWILNPDGHDKLAPIGTIGELAMEGPVLAREYLNDQISTQKAFIDNPKWRREVNGVVRPSRMYKTGDLAQYNADGTISYRGRKDTQTKIHGQRMELHEIEGHLLDHPRVEAAMVLLPKAGPYENILTAVVQVGGVIAAPVDCTQPELIAESSLVEMGVDWSDLSIYLGTKVPGYMVPKNWAAVTALPLHVTKKIDRAKVSSWVQSLSCEATKKFGGYAEKTAPLSTQETIALHISDKVGDLIDNASIKGRDSILSAIGVDSMRMSSLIAFVRKSYGVTIPMQRIIGIRTSIRDVAKHVLDAKTNPGGEAPPTLQIMKEVADLSTSFNKEREREPPSCNVFLTGASGFLGTQILRILLGTDAVIKVIALVRAKDNKHARERIINSAEEARWWSNDLSNKLETWNGDLAKPQFGLDPQRWNELHSIDAIIHNGAAVQWTADYHSLKAANVTSTKQLLSVVAASERPCCPPRFVYVSGGRDFGEDVEDTEAAQLLSSVDGYSQTKFVSELLVKQFVQKSSRNMHGVQITKPGLIIGTASEGVASKGDFLWRYVAAVIDIRGFHSPQDERDWLMVSSADEVAATTVQYILEDSGCSQTQEHITHIRDGIPLSDLWKILREDIGYDLSSMSYAEWQESLMRKVESQTESHPLWPVMHLIQEGNLAGPRPKKVTPDKTILAIKAALRKNVEYLIEVGFLKKPNPRCDPTNVAGARIKEE